MKPTPTKEKSFSDAYNEQLAVVADLKRELAEATIDLRHMADIAEAMTSERDRLKAENERMREWIRDNATHADHCQTNIPVGIITDQALCCNCGYYDAIKPQPVEALKEDAQP